MVAARAGVEGLRGCSAGGSERRFWRPWWAGSRSENRLKNGDEHGGEKRECMRLY